MFRNEQFGRTLWKARRFRTINSLLHPSAILESIGASGRGEFLRLATAADSRAKLLTNVAAVVVLLAFGVSCRSSSLMENKVLSRVDHLVYGTQDLDSTVDRLERVLGVRASYGGQHAGKGTRNALLSLGPAVYLEVLAPDPLQPDPVGPRWCGLDDVTTPRLVTWAAKARNLRSLAERAARYKIPLGAAQEGSRRLPDGSELRWRLTNPDRLIADGLVPFFIDWGTSPHPAASAPQGLRLVGLRAEHPDAISVGRMFDGLGLEIPVSDGPAPALIATIQTPGGIVELR